MSNKIWSAAALLLKWEFFEKLSIVLMSYGWAGVFGVSLLDSTFVPMPSGPDLLIVLGLSVKSTPLNITKFVLAATIGSTLGCTLLYLLARRAGIAALRHVSLERREYVQGLLGRYDALALVVVSILPPPFPFKPFILSAGVFNFKLPRFIIALLLGRTLRYMALALLAFYFGQTTIELVRSHGPRLLVGLLVIIALAAAIRYLVVKWRSVPSKSSEI